MQQHLGPKHVSLVVWFQQVAWVRSVKTLPVPCRFAGRPGNYVYVFNDYRMEEVCRSKCTRACDYYFFPCFSSAQELYRSSVCVLLPSVCAGRLPHRAVHSAEHHHAGKAADPEQHLWNRHPVSGPHCYFYHVTSVRSSLFGTGCWASWKDMPNATLLLHVKHASLPAYQHSRNKKKLLPFKNIPLASVCAVLIHVWWRGFYMQIPKGSGGRSV